MDKLRLDLAILEVECLDVSVANPNSGLEIVGIGHESAELDQSCTGRYCEDC